MHQVLAKVLHLAFASLRSVSSLGDKSENITVYDGECHGPWRDMAIWRYGELQARPYVWLISRLYLGGAREFTELPSVTVSRVPGSGDGYRVARAVRPGIVSRGEAMGDPLPPSSRRRVPGRGAGGRVPGRPGAPHIRPPRPARASRSPFPSVLRFLYREYDI